jgi:hypothetical protein
MTWSTRNTKNSAINAESGTRYHRIMTGRKIEIVSRYWIRLKRTVASGRITRGNATFLRSPALSTFAPVAMVAELAKNVQARTASIRWKT